MSETPQNAPAAGWYPDPADATRQRWWDGHQWGASLRRAPDPGGTDLGYAAAPAYPAGSVVRSDIPTNTVWIWLVVLLPLLSLGTYFLVDWHGLIAASIPSDLDDPDAIAAPTEAVLGAALQGLGLSAFGLVLSGLVILFAWLDWRELRRRGVDRPFHWGWAFLALVVSNGVYVIGRGVVLRARTGSGLAPVWVWIAVTVVGFVVSGIFASAIVSQFLEQFSHLVSRLSDSAANI